MTDWPALIAQLEQHMRHIDIAAACGRSENWVGQLKRAIIKEPPHSIGVILLALAAKYGVARETCMNPQDIAVGGEESV